MEKMEKILDLIEEVFGVDSFFCEDKCCANGKCNGCCCYDQLKEKFEEVLQ